MDFLKCSELFNWKQSKVYGYMHITVIFSNVSYLTNAFWKNRRNGGERRKNMGKIGSKWRIGSKDDFFFYWLKHSTTVTWMPQIWTHEMGSVTALPEKHGPVQLLCTSHLAKCQLGDLQDVTLNSQFLFIVVSACARLVSLFVSILKKMVPWTELSGCSHIPLVV